MLSRLLQGLVAVFVIMFAGGRMVLSQGDSAKVVTARQSIIYAVVGLVILVARTLIIFVLTKI